MKLQYIAIAVSAAFATGAYAQSATTQDTPSRNIEERSKFSGPAATGAGAGAGTQAESRTQPQAQQQQQPDRVTGQVIAVVPQGTLALTPEMVTQVQQQLQQEGYAVGAIDGMWGPRTQQGVLEFQQAEGLEATGQLNEETLAALGIGGESAATGGTGSAADSERSGNPPLPSRNIEEKSKFSGEPATGEERGAGNSSGAGGTLEPERAPIPSRNIEERSKY
ncbi:MAG TPA: peptidoglycan-binding domain-containing protein [Burkholderiales bacterium]|nr:peptidoglycan-binding domain-containing protein [Burkholderiales bacterium]